MQTGKKGIKKACLWCRSRLQNGRLQHLLHGTRQHWADVLKPKLSSEKLVNGLRMQTFRQLLVPF